MLFDLGGTLLEETSVDIDAGAKRLLDISKNPRGETHEEVQRIADQLEEEIRGRREESQMIPATSFQALLYDGLGISFELSQEEVALEFWNHGCEMKPEVGMCRLLDTLKAASIRMGVVSNSVYSGNILEKELEKHDLLDCFDFLMSSADYGFRKPHPKLFSTALGKLELRAADTWFAGDSIKYDVAGAQQMGLFTVWYNRKQASPTSPKPDLKVETWDELTDMLLEYT